MPIHMGMGNPTPYECALLYTAETDYMRWNNVNYKMSIWVLSLRLQCEECLKQYKELLEGKLPTNKTKLYKLKNQ